MTEFKKNQIVTVTIEDMGNDGEGIGHVDGYTLFVKDAVVGDTVSAGITKVKKGYAYARLVEVITPSPYRVEPRCKVSRACGGCTLQCMSYDAQLRYKKNKVRNNLVRIGGFDESLVDGMIEDTIGMDDPWRYRNKAIIPIGKDKNGRRVTGFYAAHSHNIIECKDCMLQPKEFSEVVEDLIYGESDISLTSTHLLLRKGFKTGQVMACAVENRENNAVLSGKITHILGEEVIEDYIGDMKFKISPRSFFQVNPIQVERLYDTAVTYAGLTGNETVWDLYCGIGTISLSLAKKAKKVYGVEIIEDAIRNARENAELNGIRNAEFFVGKAEEVTLRSDLEKPYVVVVDPPRKGCDPVCLDTMLRMAPKRIIYVSCDSATLARDLKVLCAEGYELMKVQPVDMFPQTTHVETVCLLINQNAQAKHHVNVSIDAEDYYKIKEGK